MASEGYQSPSLGLWAWSCTFQTIVGLLFAILSSNLSLYDGQLSKERDISWVSARNFRLLSAASLVSAVCILICSVLSYIVIPQCSKVLTKVAGVVTLFASGVAAAATGIIITRAIACQIDHWDFLHTTKNPPPTLPVTVIFAYMMKPILACMGVLALVSATLTLRVLTMRSSATALDGILYSACLALAAATGACATLQKEALAPLLVLGILWVVGTVFLLALLQQQNVCWPRVTSIALALLSVVLALLSIVTMFICAKRFIDSGLHRMVNILGASPVFLRSIDDEEYDRVKNVLASSLGFDYLVVAILGSSGLLGFAAAALASLRSILGPSPAEKEMAQDSADQALEGRNQA